MDGQQPDGAFVFGRTSIFSHGCPEEKGRAAVQEAAWIMATEQGVEQESQQSRESRVEAGLKHAGRG